MSDHDEAFATRVREVLDVVGSAAPRADREHWPPQHADRPAARPGRWLAVAAAVILVAVGVWALVSRGSETSPVTPDTTVTLPSTSTTTAQQRIIATWVDRVTGQTIAYEMDLSCFCSATGKWSVVERDGTVLQAEYLGDGEPDRPTPQLLMTRGLQLAATANGPLLVSGDDTTLQLSVDVDVDSIDDEFGFTITNFRVLPDYPQGAPTGPKVNYQLAGQLALVRGPEDATPVSGAVRAVDPRDGTIVTYAATNDDGTFSLYVPAGTYRLVGITPQSEAGQIQCQLDNITVPHPDATSLLVGCAESQRSSVTLSSARLMCGPSDQAWVEAELTSSAPLVVVAQLSVAGEQRARSDKVAVRPNEPTRIGFEPRSEPGDLGRTARMTILLASDEQPATPIATQDFVFSMPPNVQCG